MQARYEGAEWQAESSWSCNERRSPAYLAAVDDVALHPMELMFVHVNRSGAELQYPAMRAAVQYSSWQVGSFSCLSDA